MPFDAMPPREESLEDFISFLRARVAADPFGLYNPCNIHICALGQYLRTLGIRARVTFAIAGITQDEAKFVLSAYPPTWAGALHRAQVVAERRSAKTQPSS